MDVNAAANLVTTPLNAVAATGAHQPRLKAAGAQTKEAIKPTPEDTASERAKQRRDRQADDRKLDITV